MIIGDCMMLIGIGKRIFKKIKKGEINYGYRSKSKIQFE